MAPQQTSSEPVGSPAKGSEEGRNVTPANTSQTAQVHYQACQSLATLLLSPTVQSSPFTDPVVQSLIKRNLKAFTKKFQDVRFSITASPLHSRFGPWYANDFIALAPGQPLPGMGGQDWEKANDSFSIGHCQAHLQNMAYATHLLSVAAMYADDWTIRWSAMKRLVGLLETFFVHAKTRMIPEIARGHCTREKSDEKENELKGTGGFIVDTRHLILVSHSLALLAKHHPNLPIHEPMREWFTQHVAFIRESDQGQEAKESSMWSRWYFACLHSHLSYLDPIAGPPAARTALEEHWTKYPTTDDLMRSVSSTTAQHAAFFIIEPLVILTSLAIGHTCPCQILTSSGLENGAPNDGSEADVEKVGSGGIRGGHRPALEYRQRLKDVIGRGKDEWISRQKGRRDTVEPRSTHGEDGCGRQDDETRKEGNPEVVPTGGWSSIIGSCLTKEVFQNLTIDRSR